MIFSNVKLVVQYRRLWFVHDIYILLLQEVSTLIYTRLSHYFTIVNHQIVYVFGSP